MMTRRCFLASVAAPRPVRPNIVFILLDDFGWTSIGCYGHRIVPTPNMDRLAREGMRFTQAYATPQCTPTRATLMTGQYTARNRMWHVIPGYGLPHAWVEEPRFEVNLGRETFNLAKGLKAAGYRTGIFGKWHLTANADGAYNELRPQAASYYGFDEVNRPLPADATRTGDKGVDWLTDGALEFMKKGGPFFCYLSHHTTHGPLTAPPELVRKWRDKGHPEEGENNAVILAMLEHLDTSIGRLLDSLPANTAIFLSADNGGVWEAFDKDTLQVERRVLSNAPLRAGKGFAYEGGIRVPLLVRWPGTVKPGTLCHTPVHMVDYLPTLFGMAGAAAPPSHTLDGVDLQPLLRGKPIPSRPLYWWMPLYDLRWLATPSAVIRDGRYKLIEYFGDYASKENGYRKEPRVELFDLERDPGEAIDLASKDPARAARLRAKLHAWIRSCGQKIPGRNPRHNAALELKEERLR